MSAKFDRDLLGHQPEPAPKVQVFPRNVTSMPRLSATNSVTCRSQREGIVCPENTDSGAFGSCCWERIKTPLHKNILDWNETTAPGEFQKLECVLRLGYCLGVGCTVLDPPCVLQKGHKNVFQNNISKAAKDSRVGKGDLACWICKFDIHSRTGNARPTEFAWTETSISVASGPTRTNFKRSFELVLLAPRSRFRVIQMGGEVFDRVAVFS